MTLGEKIVSHRKRMGLSQEELASRLGVSRQAVSKWERDEAQPELDKVIALAKLFGISTDALLTDQAAQESGDPVMPSQRQGRFAAFLRRRGWIGGLIIAAYGTGILLIGLLAHFLFRRMMEPNPLLGGTAALLHSGTFELPLIFSSIVSGIGAGILLLGAILAIILYRRRNR